ncbi:hypothetical protein CIT292_10547 [Citrobacter youngae ATCC 29220]|uniref:Uncharacterized protein n=1 Tax=Citrobacter youngae ATCC 29220 TaxID=500640 RepID=D4BJ30_9ENTR|nr:hypothetical protein CIT292_10547 [Citrobacter youngae ATCC 29220]
MMIMYISLFSKKQLLYLSRKTLNYMKNIIKLTKFIHIFTHKIFGAFYCFM